MILDDSQKEFLQLLAYLYIQHQKYDKAYAIFEALQYLYPEDTEIIRSLSFLELTKGNAEKALELAEASLIEPVTPRQRAASLFLKSQALWKLGKTEDARRVLKQFIQLRGPVSV